MIQCVWTELFPVLSVKLTECVQEKLAEEASFKQTDFREAAVSDIIERLKRKRAMNNKEIQYLEGLIRKAIGSQDTRRR